MAERLTPDPTPPLTEEGADQLRRRLLKLGLYVTPLIVGTLVMQRSAAAQVSCGPSACGPNGQCGPCGPDFCKPRS